jgi:hypothetical protein
VKPLPRAVIWSTAALGLLIRLWTLRSPLGQYNSDDAVVGLMAFRINAGEHFLFYWGQDYGGAFEPEITAIVFKVLPANSLTLRIAPMGLHALSAWLLACVGTRVLDRGRGELAGLLWWMAPSVGVLWSIHAGGYYGALVAVGLGIALLALRLRERLDRRDAVALGALLGIGVWTSPQIALLVAVPLGYLALRRTTWRLAPYIAVPALVVLIPWLRHQRNHHWVSLRPPAAVLPMTYFDRVRVWWRALPTMLGFQLPYRSTWIFPGAVVMFAAVVVALVVVIARTRPASRFLIMWAIAVPFWFALSPYATSAFVIRYLYPCLPILALVIAISFRRHVTALVVLAIAAVLSVVTIVDTANYTEAHPRFSYETTPPDLTPLIEHLDAAGIDRVWADYFVAYRLTFATGERIIAAPIDSSRYVPYVEQVRAARTNTYVLAACDAFFGRSRFDEHDVAYTEVIVDDFVVFTLSEPGRPADLGFHVGTYRQYGCAIP